VLGANDGIISTASLVVGVAAAARTCRDILTAAVAGWAAGAMAVRRPSAALVGKAV
jgi:VIT1/CCC1 family predicted Fe2+/Mn2+ transporter